MKKRIEILEEGEEFEQEQTKVGNSQEKRKRSQERNTKD